jgi:hypothetical protein
MKNNMANDQWFLTIVCLRLLLHNYTNTSCGIYLFELVLPII